MGWLTANWKTTLAGALAAGATLASDTLCDWIGIVDPASRDAVRVKILAAGLFLVGLLSRDWNKTSEESKS